MSEPRQVWLDIDESDIPQVCDWYAEFPDLAWVRRYTLTDGDEYRALIELAREALETPNYKNAMLKSEALNALLVYLGETP